MQYSAQFLVEDYVTEQERFDLSCDLTKAIPAVVTSWEGPQCFIACSSRQSLTFPRKSEAFVNLQLIERILCSSVWRGLIKEFALPYEYMAVAAKEWLAENAPDRTIGYGREVVANWERAHVVLPVRGPYIVRGKMRWFINYPALSEEVRKNALYLWRLSIALVLSAHRSETVSSEKMIEMSTLVCEELNFCVPIIWPSLCGAEEMYPKLFVEAWETQDRRAYR